ncbi:1,4-beta-xylanase [Pelobium manganitolerans]|uniref:Beta-xylanase n=1 Tax=Pelobium manganitolerans TaxID=1842495 RepID=A0A419S360_9SPHI|nr:endo-1,4-beta-xylanase [Pelobium manganitolerans]RKD13303.1 1,4-beta-xylanase [Pelobium manganitolerans]
MNGLKFLAPVCRNLVLALTILVSAFSAAFAQKGLKDYYKGYFKMGVAVTPRDLKDEKTVQLIKQNYNSITAENAMKMVSVHPEENRYFWRDADAIVDFAEKNKIAVRGHTLCWHTQAPQWMFKDSLGNEVSKDLLLKRLKDHIYTVAGRYKGKIYAWDVVNEVIADDSLFLRKSKWSQITGEDFIVKAFEYAHEADPKALLFYNDYNTEIPAKRDKIYKLVKSLKDRGVPIHGVGLQGHWSINNPSREELEKSIQMFSSLGLQVHITELDVSVYAGRQGGQIGRNQGGAATSPFTPEMEEKQIEKYKMIFDVLRKYKKEVSSVTFWNVSDRYTWLDMRGRKNYPLLFDTNLEPKKVYWEVVKF